jgi:hypothetical protein
MTIYEIDELANIVAMANEKEQLAIIEDIAANGQQESAVLWQGKLVDGRCRQLACQALGIELKVRHLDDALTRSEVAKIVKSLNTRRNLTMTQKIVSAYYQQFKTGETNNVVARQWAISVPSLKNIKFIAKHAPDLVAPLFNGDTVVVKDVDSNIDIVSNKVSTIARLVKKAKEHVNLVVDDSEEFEFTVDGNIKTEAAKDWYYGVVSRLGIKDPMIRILMVELANFKFREAP